MEQQHFYILKKLNATFNANFYLVGGFVRDLLLNIKSFDYDIATDLEPEKLIALAEQKNLKVIASGLKHGTVTLLLDNLSLEITTFRQDLENNGRHCKVVFTKSIKQDSLRRDFTINALYLDANGKLYDFYNGKDDLLNKGIVRFIGNPEQRIQEDYLRILRFFRFYANFDKRNISLKDDNLKKLLNNYALCLKKLSADRISQEFLKICDKSNSAKAFKAMAQIDNLAELFKLKLANIQQIPDDIHLNSFTRLCIIYRKNLADLLNNELFNWSNKQKQFVKNSIKQQALNWNLDTWLKLAANCQQDVAEFMLLEMFLDKKILKIELKQELQVLYFNMPKFDVSGVDLIKLGVKPGKQIGSLLSKIKDYWIENNFPEKEKCMKFASKIIKN